jgi:hypothetical protein
VLRLYRGGHPEPRFHEGVRVPRAPAPSPKLTMVMPKATRGLASVFGTELTDGWVRPETSRASRDLPVQAPRPGLFFWRQTPDRQRHGDHEDGADNTNDRKLAEHYRVSFGHTLPLGRVSYDGGLKAQQKKEPRCAKRGSKLRDAGHAVMRCAPCAGITIRLRTASL